MSSLSEVSVARACSRDASAEEVEGASGRGTRPEPRVSKPEVTIPSIPELRTGAWTRFGADSVLGDTVTEQTLATLAESTRATARAQGYSIGWAEGQRAAKQAAFAEAEVVAAQRQQADAVRAAEHASAIAALELAAARLHDAVAGTCAAIESSASELAWALTDEIVGYAVTNGDVDPVRRVLALLPTAPIARVRLHPADAAGAEELAAHGVQVLADATLNRGDALAEVDDHVLDLRLDAALARVREVLLGGTPR